MSARSRARSATLAIAAAGLLLGACSSDTGSSSAATPELPVTKPTDAANADPAETSPTIQDATDADTDPAETSPTIQEGAETESHSFRAEVWADNWFSLYVNGQLVGEDSVPITTERSFNAETLTFEATYPLTISMVSKDFKETDSGLEYIGTDRQQMGDGGFIAQFTDLDTGTVVGATGADWRGLVIHRAPLNVDCVTSADPNTDCRFEALDEPVGWTEPGFDDSTWTAATIQTEEAVGVKDGYLTIGWDPMAALIWSTDLQVDNTILWRATVSAP